MPHEVTVIKGRRFPTCRHCRGIAFQLTHAAKHVSEIEHFEAAPAAVALPAALIEGIRFAADYPLERTRFEPSVPLETLAPGPRTAWFAFCSPETR